MQRWKVVIGGVATPAGLVGRVGIGGVAARIARPGRVAIGGMATRVGLVGRVGIGGVAARIARLGRVAIGWMATRVGIFDRAAIDGVGARAGLFGRVAIGVLATQIGLFGQSPKAPDAYSLTQVNSMMGPSVTSRIYVDGVRAVVDSEMPAQPGGTAVHTHALYELRTHKTLSWSPGNASVACATGTFSGDWGDPFAASAEMQSQFAAQKSKAAGAANINGIAAKVLEAPIPGGGSGRLWVDAKSGLTLKFEMTTPDGKKQTIVEVKQFAPGKPPASVFEIPASCAGAASAAPPTEEERIASETGSAASDFLNAMMPPPSQNSCTVLFRVARAGSMETIAGGYQVAVDRNVNLDHPASYTMGGGEGRVTFSGGGLREETAGLRNGVLRIDNAPAQFDVELSFGSGGAASALIYRQCPRPESMLVFVVKNPANLAEGGDWLWVKSGKWAAGR